MGPVTSQRSLPLYPRKERGSNDQTLTFFRKIKEFHPIIIKIFNCVGWKRPIRQDLKQFSDHSMETLMLNLTIFFSSKAIKRYSCSDPGGRTQVSVSVK